MRPGDPILAVAAEKSRYLISYVRQEQRFTPKAGMAVEMRGRTTPGATLRSVAEPRGPQVEAIPPHMCRDPKIPEWGLPVRIALPAGLVSHPGELFEVTFKLRGEDKS